MFLKPTIQNFQLLIVHAEKAGVFLSFHAGFSTKDAGFFLFSAYLFKSNKRLSRIRTEGLARSGFQKIRADEVCSIRKCAG